MTILQLLQTVATNGNPLEMIWALIGIACLVVNGTNLRESWRNRFAVYHSPRVNADTPGFRLTAQLALEREGVFVVLQLALCYAALRSLFYPSPGGEITWDSWLLAGLFATGQVIMAIMSVRSMRGQKRLITLYRASRPKITRNRS